MQDPDKKHPSYHGWLKKHVKSEEKKEKSGETFYNWFMREVKSLLDFVGLVASVGLMVFYSAPLFYSQLFEKETHLGTAQLFLNGILIYLVIISMQISTKQNEKK